MANYSFNWDENGLRSVLRGSEGEVATEIRKRGNRVLNRARQGAPVHTGVLRASIHMDMTEVDGAPQAVISTNLEYAIYQEMGTGVFGPRHQRIFAHPPRMALRYVQNGRVVYRRSVAGTPGKHFMEKALEAARE